ncbi:Ribosomal RNA-processing 8 [Chlorella sorokiniana]|uniref:Ribosomal RNA-processing protein 8 n=1 Tax=Chlorella sorokiniana TaxID=3076 RepID=A0A2P6TWF8_CHLSO|nr:Ribosomal RNA-processing 8 [Chlorella sorokiniana]|eukprot:PRW58393.1 Ribosomal RNA-processing 8 [Chlorella sorokiniana]
MEGAPPAKKRKSKNKFKPTVESAAQPAAPAPAAAALHATAAGQAKKKKRKRGKHAAAVDETVAAQPDAPGAVQQQPLPPPPAAASRGPGGRSVFAPPGTSGGKKAKGGGSLLQQMRQRLQGGRFRWLNETLYTTDGTEALRLMSEQPELMEQYHEGFREQTKGWPTQPVDQAIRWLRGRPPGWVVADLGCGDAKIAATVQQKVHSFDLVATAPGVVACNMAALPLPDASVDATIFCLSLMGTDYGLFLQEAARILKPGGWLWIAEVQSRFVAGSGDGGGGGGSGGNSVLPSFLAALGTLGFAVRCKDTANSHFIVLELQRQDKGGGGGGKQRQPAWPPLRPCQYKKR